MTRLWFHVGPDTTDDFLKVATTYIGWAESQSGCQRGRIVSDARDQRRHGLIVEWSDEASFRRHLLDENYVLWIAAAERLYGPVEMTVSWVSQQRTFKEPKELLVHFKSRTA